MDFTTYFGLKKPLPADFYNIGDFNENADKIDNALNNLQTDIDALKTYIGAWNKPGTPASITVPTLKSGSTVTLSWAESTDPMGKAITYEVEYLLNIMGGTPPWQIAYEGSATSCTFTVLQDARAYDFRVRAKNSDNVYSTGYAQSDHLYVIHAPTVPSPITVPELNAGTDVTLSWGTSHGRPGEPITYEVEYLLNIMGGTPSWQVAYEGSATSCTFTVLQDARAYDFRVRAKNSENVYSTGYAQSGHLYVIHTPTVPSPITVPVLNAGTNVTLSWGTSTGRQGEPITYKVEYLLSIKGGTPPWQVAYEGSATSSTFTVLQDAIAYDFRVRAKNSDNVCSAYAESGRINVV